MIPFLNKLTNKSNNNDNSDSTNNNNGSAKEEPFVGKFAGLENVVPLSRN